MVYKQIEWLREMRFCTEHDNMTAAWLHDSVIVRDTE